MVMLTAGGIGGCMSWWWLQAVMVVAGGDGYDRAVLVRALVSWV